MHPNSHLLTLLPTSQRKLKQSEENFRRLSLPLLPNYLHLCPYILPFFVLLSTRSMFLAKASPSTSVWDPNPCQLLKDIFPEIFLLPPAPQSAWKTCCYFSYFTKTKENFLTPLPPSATVELLSFPLQENSLKKLCTILFPNSSTQILFFSCLLF